MLRTCRNVIARAGLVVAVAAAAIAFAIPAAAASGGSPEGGGCHMVTSPSATGLYHMMAGSANGEGAAHMVEMLSIFSPDPFCGI